MKTNFNHYSFYYDLLYADKDYPSEVQYIRGLMDKFAIQPIRSLLEIGCGTGIHASALATQGLNVLGIDRSDDVGDVERVAVRCGLCDRVVGDDRIGPRLVLHEHGDFKPVAQALRNFAREEIGGGTGR